MAVFSDLCVGWNEGNNTVEEKVKQLIRLGYKLFAVNNVFTHQPKPKGKKEKSQQKPLTAPQEILLPEEKLKIQFHGTITNTGEKVKQLSRLTVVFSEAEQMHTLQSADVQAYDLLAVQPTTEKLFHMACGTLDIDIITVNMTEHMPFRYKRPSLNMAVERGVYFEIQYGPMIRDRVARKNIIANVQMLLEVGKGKNLILSSGCKNPLDIRSPYDVTALGLMLGFSEPKAKQALSTNCNSVLLHAGLTYFGGLLSDGLLSFHRKLSTLAFCRTVANGDIVIEVTPARKAGRSVVSISRLDGLANQDKWIVDATDPATLESEESSPEDSEEGTEDSEDESYHEPPTKKKKDLT